MDPVLDGCPGLHQNLPVSREIPELTILSREDPGWLDQAVESELGDSLGIFQISLSSGNVLDLVGIGNNDLDLRLKKQVKFVPMDPGDSKATRSFKARILSDVWRKRWWEYSPERERRQTWRNSLWTSILHTLVCSFITSHGWGRSRILQEQFCIRIL